MRSIFLSLFLLVGIHAAKSQDKTDMKYPYSTFSRVKVENTGAGLQGNGDFYVYYCELTNQSAQQSLEMHKIAHFSPIKKTRRNKNTTYTIDERMVTSTVYINGKVSIDAVGVDRWERVGISTDASLTAVQAWEYGKEQDKREKVVDEKKKKLE